MPHLDLSYPRPDIAETLCGYGKFGVESTKQVNSAAIDRVNDSIAAFPAEYIAVPAANMNAPTDTMFSTAAFELALR